MPETYADIDAYIATFPDEVQDVLEDVRRAIHAAVPGATEAISYHMPTITLDGRSLVHFAAWKQHLGLYPLPDGPADLEADLAPYRASEGTARFPYDQPVPYALIGRLAASLAAERGRGAHG
ncbi:MAG TPA: DUF1801 domain-containing protein [Candidatus Limnocylindria bacterium]|nr:DUF1801 domain-containing protein [Candidatus Limnocylindria bacterium]